MLLATQCPHCFTSFRVANDQLKLHAGLVRCGACQQTFNGIEYLLAPGAKPAQAPNVAPNVPALVVAEGHPKEAVETEVFTPIQVAIPEFERSIVAEIVAPVDAVSIVNIPNYAPYSDPNQNIVEARPSSSLEFDLEEDAHLPQLDGTEIKQKTEAEPQEKEASHDDSLSQISLFNLENDDIALRTQLPEPSSLDQEQDFIEESGSKATVKELRTVEQLILGDQVKPWNLVVNSPPLNEEEASENVDLEKPDFVIQAEKKQGRSRLVHISMFTLSTLLFFALLAQSAYSFRNQIAGWLPQTKPMLQEACKLLQCRVELPTHIEAISIESNELQALSNDKNIFSLSIQLQNKSSILQTWPMLELILNDVKDRPVVRRVFTPADYLANKNDLMKGLTANSDQTIKLYFELSGPKAAGYHVGVFYP